MQSILLLSNPEPLGAPPIQRPGSNLGSSVVIPLAATALSRLLGLRRRINVLLRLRLRIQIRLLRQRHFLGCGRGSASEILHA